MIWDISAIHARRDAVAAAVEALAAPGALEPFDVGFATTAIERIGDALRVAVAVPAPLARWLEQRTMVQLAAVIAELRVELDALPAPQPPSEHTEHLLEQVACSRDRAESTVRALARARAGQDVAPVFVAGFEALLDVLADVDRSLADIGREATVRALGDRRWLLLGHDWTATLPSVDDAAALAMSVPAWEGELPASLQPPPAAVLAYAERGELATWVEATAKRSDVFRARLTSTIDDLWDADETVGIAALRWRHAGPIALPVRPAARAHAAGQDLASTPPVERRLGRLHPLAVEGRLLGYPDAVEVRIAAAAGVVASVTLGDVRVTGADEHGVWVARAAAADQTLVLRVEATTGERFEAVLQIDPTG